jgi:hypothetical protein
LLRRVTRPRLTATAINTRSKRCCATRFRGTIAQGTRYHAPRGLS